MSRSRRMPPLFEVMRETTPARTPLTPVPVTPPSLPSPPSSQPQLGPTPIIRTIPATSPPSPSISPTPPREPAAPTPLTLRQPSPPASPPDDPPATSPRARSGPGGWDFNRTMLIPFKSILIAASVVMALLILVWYIGWKFGAEAGKQELLAGIELDPSLVTSAATLPAQDPLSGGAPSSTARPPQQPASQPPTQGGTRPSQPQNPTSPAITQAPKPPAGTPLDPRGTALNYLWVETVTTLADADGIVAFLQANGLPAVAVPRSKVDIATARAKNERNWEVVLLEGIPSNEYRASATRRRALEDRVKALGQQLAKEGLSAFNLSSPQWKKY